MGRVSASEDLRTLADDYWTAYLTQTPSEAYLLGHPPQVGTFDRVDRAEEDAAIAEQRDLANRAEAIDPGELDDQESLTRDVLIWTGTAIADAGGARLRELSADPIFGEQTSLPMVLGMIGLPDAETAGTAPDLLVGVGRYFTELAERHREGVAHGRTPARFAVTGVIEQIEAALAVSIDEDPMVSALQAPGVEGFDEAGWRDSLREVVKSRVRPALAAYRDVLHDEVLEAARPDDRCGLSWLPDGEDAYSRMLRFSTTTAKSAQEIHETGLAQIEALGEEYRSLGGELLGTDDLQQIFDKMRDDPALHFETGEQLVEAARTAMARASAAMGGWFETLPASPCTVEATVTGAKAFYFPPATDGSRGGSFFINVDDPSSWGTFELEAMAFHEGIPGHHLQLAIAAELPDAVPEFRKHVHNTAYAEGWGLYSERLADEMGLYSSGIDRLGMLSADSMRACRLVVDTGLHALGWSRQQAVDYMLANSPLTAGVVRPEIDRYVVTPGQATSYMIGRLEIQRIRREAEQRQGAGFEVKAFHSAVLDSGSLPLEVLDRVVTARLP